MIGLIIRCYKRLHLLNQPVAIILANEQDKGEAPAVARSTTKVTSSFMPIENDMRLIVGSLAVSDSPVCSILASLFRYHRQFTTPDHHCLHAMVCAAAFTGPIKSDKVKPSPARKACCLFVERIIACCAWLLFHYPNILT